MIPTRRDIILKIPAPRGTELKLVDIQSTEDIVLCILNSINLSKWYVRNYSHLFFDDSIEGTCENIWNFMKDNFIFNPESGKLQTGRTIRYIIYDPHGKGKTFFDCKHFSTFALATLQGLGIKSHLRLCGYDRTDLFPTHVYVIAYDESGNEIIIDGTLDRFNQESDSLFQQNVHTINPVAGLRPGRIYTADEIEEIKKYSYA